jgi:hypothetical protein
MDDNQTDSLKKLEELSKDSVKKEGIALGSEKIVIDGKKISNKFLKIFISKLEEQGSDPEVIIKLIKDIDEGVENGEITEKSFDSLTLKGGINE